MVCMTVAVPSRNAKISDSNNSNTEMQENRKNVLLYGLVWFLHESVIFLQKFIVVVTIATTMFQRVSVQVQRYN